MTEAQVDGRKAWVVVAAAFLGNSVVFGVAYSFGAFFKAMADEFESGRGATALVFSLTAFLWFTLGALTGTAADRYGSRPLVLVGALAITGGLLLTSMVDSLWMAYITYGLGVGIGVGCVYVPLVATVGGWFDRHRAFALGVAVAGVGVGTLVANPAAAALVQEYGFRTAFVVFGVFAAGTLLLVALGARRPPRPGPAAGGSAPRFTLALVRGGTFVRLYVSAVGMSMAIFAPFVFLAPFASDKGISAVSAASLVSFLGAASVAGRLLLGLLGSRFELLSLYRSCFLAIAVSLLFWMASGGRYEVLVFFAIFFGAAYGGWIALSPAVAARLYGPEQLGTVLGILYTGGGIGGLAGPPTMGAIIDAANSYAVGIAAAAALGALSWLLLLPLREGAASVGRSRQPARAVGSR